MSKMMTGLEEILTNFMLLAQHKTISFSKYKESSRLMVRVCDFIDLFATVNQNIIAKD